MINHWTMIVTAALYAGELRSTYPCSNCWNSSVGGVLVSEAGNPSKQACSQLKETKKG